MFAFRKIFTVPAVTSVAAASSSSSAALCSKAATLFSSAAAANLCAVRYCSAAAPAATSTPTPTTPTTTSSSSGGNRYQERRGNFNRDRDQRRNSSSSGNFRNNSSSGSGNSGRNAVQPLRANVEFYDVRDSPKDGRELRLSFRSDAQQRGGNSRSQDQHAKQLTLTILPQLGPRKTDPHDPTPQFDNAARVGLRLRAQEVAEILMWLVGRNKAESHTLGSTNTRIELKKHDSGVITVAVTARKLDGNMGEPLAFELQPHQQVQFRIFLEESLYAYWDFSAF